MAFLRDTLARFSVLVDDKPLTDLDRRIDLLKSNLARVATVAATVFAGTAYTAYRFVDAASDANESLNVLKVTFGSSADAVIDWSKTMGKEIGRSEYTLQESVGRFGAFLQPVFEGSNQDIALMSKKLAGLAVDLASFYNTSDEEAQMRLFSGISGETEAVRRLGIDISDTSLDAFNKSRGDKRRLASLTLQEKSRLRYDKIVQDTVKKQGDAARTAGDWANSVRRLTDSFKTLAVQIGQKLLPFAKSLLAWAEKTTQAFGGLILKSAALETALGVLTVTGSLMFVEWAMNSAKFAKAMRLLYVEILPMVIPLAAIATSFLIIESVVTFLRGGKSIFGDMLVELYGVKKPLDHVLKTFEELKSTLADVVAYIAEVGRNLLVLSDYKSGNFKSAFGTLGWSPRVSQHDEANDQDAGKRMYEDGVKAVEGHGDIGAYKRAYSGLGLDDQQIKDRFLRDRRIALGNGTAIYNEKDEGAGLERPVYHAPTAPTEDRSLMSLPRDYSEAPRAARAPVTITNAPVVTVNVTQPNATPEQIESAVTEALAKCNRETMSCVGEEM